MKIVQAVNSMIASKGKITNVIIGHDEDYYFMFGQHKWSVGMDSDGYYVHYYPGDQPLEELAAAVYLPWQPGPASVTYSTNEIKTREATETFSELYRVVKEKLYNVDSVLDEIIGKNDF